MLELPRLRLLGSWIGIGALALSLGACALTPMQPPSNLVAPGPSPSAAPSAAPSPTPSPTPPAPAALRLDFDDLPLGAPPADFVDVATERELPAWVYVGHWQVSRDEHGNQVLLHDDVREQPAVSFQRYRGNALGTPNGQVPPVYYSEVRMRPLKSPHNYPPTGDQGVQFYYLDYNRYLEVVVKPDAIEIWEADEGAPKTTKGWKRLWGQALATKAGDVRRIGALVDSRAGTFTAYLDGKPLSTVSSALIKPQPAWVALRGIGNVVSFDELLIEPR